MVTAIVCINVKHDQIHEVAQKLVDMKAITEVYSVGGEYDLVAMVRVENNAMLEEFMTQNILKLKEIQKTETMIAFKTYSNYDLARMFSIGFESQPD